MDKLKEGPARRTKKADVNQAPKRLFKSYKNDVNSVYTEICKDEIKKTMNSILDNTSIHDSIISLVNRLAEIEKIKVKLIIELHDYTRQKEENKCLL